MKQSQHTDAQQKHRDAYRHTGQQQAAQRHRSQIARTQAERIAEQRLIESIRGEQARLKAECATRRAARAAA